MTDYAATFVGVDSFYPYVATEAPGVAYLEFVHAVRRACDEFCRNTMVWRVTLPTITVVAGTENYDLTLPTSSSLGRVTEVRYLPSATDTPIKLTEVMADDVERLEAEWAGGDPVGYSLPDSKSIRLIPSPPVSASVVVKAALKPSRDATSFAAILFDDYVEAVSAGALWFLRMTPGKPYYDPQSAQFSRDRFLMYTGMASVEAAQGFTRAPFQSDAAW